MNPWDEQLRGQFRGRAREMLDDMNEQAEQGLLGESTRWWAWKNRALAAEAEAARQKARAAAWRATSTGSLAGALVAIASCLIVMSTR